MKKLILAVLLNGFSVALFAQWSGTNPVTTNGNVGIGTSAPETQLMINSTYMKLALGKVPLSQRGGLGWAQGYIGFNIAESGAGWNMNGDGTSNGGAMFLTNPFGQFSILTFPSTGGGDQYYNNTQLPGRARFSISGAAGNVGIGERSDLARTPLEITKWGNNSSISTVLTLSQLNDASPNNAAGVAMDFSIGNNYNNNNAQARITVKETYWGVRPKMIFSFWNESYVMTDRVFFTYDGNVGIGQSNPTNKLDVNGTAHAKEVKVDLTGWEDRVFNKDYSLLPLTDLEKFIERQHHLPEVPTEAEVIENGIELGAMNRLLVKKIEELTLYILQQQKTNDEQSKKIAELEKRIAN